MSEHSPSNLEEIKEILLSSHKEEEISMNKVPILWFVFRSFLVAAGPRKLLFFLSKAEHTNKHLDKYDF